MGLEFVELITALEEEFGLTIPNEDAAQLVTVRAIYEYVREHSPQAAGRSNLYEAVLDVIERETAVERARLVPDAHLVRDLNVN